MSVQSTIDIGRSLLRETLRWALPRLAIYVFGVLGAVFAFTIWAVIYTYVWPGKPQQAPAEMEQHGRFQQTSSLARSSAWWPSTAGGACCALAASGQPAAAPPRSVAKNLRRPMWLAM